MNNQQNYQNEPAFPTQPVADKFGSVLMFFGLTKVEFMAALIAGHYVGKGPNDSILYPEVVAEESFLIAQEILKMGEANRKNSKDGGFIEA